MIALVASCESEGAAVLPDDGEGSAEPEDAASARDDGHAADGCAAECSDAGSSASFGFRVTSLPVEIAALTSVWGSSPSDVWASATGGYVFHWDGATWEANRIGGSHSFFSIWGTGPDDVWAVSATAFVKHTKGWNGASTIWKDWPFWTYDAGSSNSPVIRRLWGLDRNTFFVAGRSVLGQPSAYLIQRAPSSDLTVTPLDVLEDVELFGVHGTSLADVWFVGKAGLARHLGASAADGGPTITSPNTGMKGIAYAVWARTPEDAWLVGETGAIRHYTREDGLLMWTPVPSPTTRPLFAIWGRAADDIWAVGDHGVIVHYDGVRWTLGETTFPQPIQPALLGVWGTPTGEVWIVGDGVALRREATR